MRLASPRVQVHRLGVLVLRVALVLVLATAVSCDRGALRGEGERAAPAPRSGAALDVGAVVRQVHFAFRPDGDGWSGRHGTYAAHATARSLRVTPIGARRGAEGAPFVAELAAVDRGGARVAEGPARVTARPDATLDLDRGALVEHLENTEDGVEQSFVLAAPPAGRGDVAIRIAVSGEGYTGATAAGLHFADPATGLGVRYGAATWVDARGDRTPVAAAFDRGAIVLTVPEALVDRSAYPAVLDPAIGPEIGTDNPVYEPSGIPPGGTAVAYGAGQILVVWEDDQSGSDGPAGVFAARVSQATGALLDPGGIVVSTVGASPQVASDGTGWMVVYTQPDAAMTAADIYGARVSAAGALLDPSGFPVATGGHYTAPAVAFGGGGYLVSGIALGPDASVEAVPVSTGGVPGSPITVSSGLWNPHGDVVAWNGASYLVAFDNLEGMTIGARRVAPSGAVLDVSDIPVCTTACGELEVSSLASDGADWLLAWPGGSAQILGARVTAGGAAPDGASGFAIAALPMSSTVRSVSVAYGGGAYGVFWDDGPSLKSDAVYGARVDPTGAVVTAPTQLGEATGASADIAATYDGTGFYVAYVAGGEVVGALVGDALVTLTEPPTLISQAANLQQYPAVGFNGTDYLVVWSDGRTPSGPVYATRVSAAGVVLDPSGIQVSAVGGNLPGVALASDGTDWLVVFGYAPILGARVLADGTAPDGDGFPINAGDGFPAVAWGGGSYLVTWMRQSSPAGEQLGDVFATRVSPAGVVLDPDPGIQVTTDGDNANPSIAFNGDNHLVVFQKAWNVWAARVTPGGVVLDPDGLEIAAADTFSTATPAVASGGQPRRALLRERRLRERLLRRRRVLRHGVRGRVHGVHGQREGLRRRRHLRTGRRGDRPRRRVHREPPCDLRAERRVRRAGRMRALARGHLVRSRLVHRHDADGRVGVRRRGHLRAGRHDGVRPGIRVRGRRLRAAGDGRGRPRRRGRRRRRGHDEQRLLVVEQRLVEQHLVERLLVERQRRQRRWIERRHGRHRVLVGHAVRADRRLRLPSARRCPSARERSSPRRPDRARRTSP